MSMTSGDASTVKPPPPTSSTAAEGEEPSVALIREPWQPPGPWADDALCAQTDPDSFFPEKGGETRTAKATCARCLVRAECLDYALANNERFGVWGGLSERERRKLIGLADIDTEACGTYPKGYNRHTSKGEKPCDDCRLAANDYAQRRRDAARATA